MSEETDNVPASAEPPRNNPRRSRRVPIIVAIVAMVAIVVAVAVWLLWPRQAGKPVPAPRTVSFQESSQTPMATGEQRLTLTPEQLRSVQLKIETVGEAPSTEAAGQMATGVVQANSYKETPVVSLVGGIVRNVSAELGQNVKRGQRVAVIFSNELADAQARYLTAAAVLDEHHRHHMRTAKLVEIGAASRQELEMATSQLRDAESNLANLRQKLMLLGLSAQRIDSLNSTSQVSSEVNVTTPNAGTITSRSVNSGEVIEANKELMRVTDLSTVWIVGQVYEKDLATVRVGSGANVTSDAYTGQVFRGRVTYVDPKIDPATRTAQVRIELANPRQMFKIGMFVNVAFGALGVGEKTVPMIPKDAVQIINNQQVVFVATEEPMEFIMRPVRLAAETNGLYPVLEGVNAGDRIVTQGSFLLRAESLKRNPPQ
ncbi:MAG TPA: efflux RND transporter periplasmic adaptor subunit [Pyrinomonadaceae bacterium]|jgi:RND family efflux transporter MFP subunit|nr:efflux RND transporter periplasmic adaptor subunit [Pyrinomonadaceae bacterium]